MSLIAVAKLVGVFGIRGELKCRAEAGHEDALSPGREYALGSAPDAPRLHCTSLRRHHKRQLIAFAEIVTPEEARDYVGRELYAHSLAAPLAPNEYPVADLIGLQLLDEAGRKLGEVVGIEHFPAQDCLQIGPGRALVPFVAAFVRAIDLEARTIVMALPEGLL
jgi:16S rRNA processing protein RimM